MGSTLIELLGKIGRGERKEESLLETDAALLRRLQIRNTFQSPFGQLPKAERGRPKADRAKCLLFFFSLGGMLANFGKVQKLQLRVIKLNGTLL